MAVDNAAIATAVATPWRADGDTAIAIAIGLVTIVLAGVQVLLNYLNLEAIRHIRNKAEVPSQP